MKSILMFYRFFLANTGWNFFTEGSVTIPANTGFNLKRKFV